jgi:hypothetical protein
MLKEDAHFGLTPEGCRRPHFHPRSHQQLKIYFFPSLKLGTCHLFVRSAANYRDDQTKTADHKLGTLVTVQYRTHRCRVSQRTSTQSRPFKHDSYIMCILNLGSNHEIEESFSEYCIKYLRAFRSSQKLVAIGNLL